MTVAGTNTGSLRLAIWGLSVSSSWGNGHATLWRGLLRALVRRGHRVTFFEKDVPWYATHRDLREIPGVNLVLYPDWDDVRTRAAAELREADVAIVTSYCPDAQAATDLISSGHASRVFYDLDAPVTLSRIARGEAVEYVPRDGYRSFDLVLSYTGGRALDDLKTVLGAREAVPIYGSVDPEVHHPAASTARWQGDLSYLGTWAADRQRGVEKLLVEPARSRPQMKFILGGAMYDDAFPWTSNIFFNQHVPPPDHSSFYCSSRLTLNVTREAMANYGFCPSGRLFEAAACGAAIVTDVWDGLDQFFAPGSEILTASNTEDVLAALDLPPSVLASISKRAFERTLDEHTAAHRARDMENALTGKSLPLEPVA